MALHRCSGEARKLVERHLDGVFQALRQTAETRSEDKVQAGAEAGPPMQNTRTLPDPRPTQISTPAIAAVMKAAIEPPIMALSASRDRSCRRRGAIPPMPPIWIAIDEKLAKPDSA